MSFIMPPAASGFAYSGDSTPTISDEVSAYYRASTASSSASSASAVYYPDDFYDRAATSSSATRPPVNVDRFAEEDTAAAMQGFPPPRRTAEEERINKEYEDLRKQIEDSEYRKRAEIALDAIYKVIKSELIDVMVQLMKPSTSSATDRKIDEIFARNILQRNRNDDAHTYRMGPWIVNNPNTTYATPAYSSWESLYGIGR